MIGGGAGSEGHGDDTRILLCVRRRISIASDFTRTAKIYAPSLL